MYLFKTPHPALRALICILTFLISGTTYYTYGGASNTNEVTLYTAYTGVVVDQQTKEPLVAATIAVQGTNISTITNNEGEFLIKIPSDVPKHIINVYFLGYADTTINLRNLDTTHVIIGLETAITELPEVMIDSKDPATIMRAVLKNKGINYLDDHTIMTAFYRETIKKRRSYVSLSEAVVDVYKNPYTSKNKDAIKLYRARKSTDYKKLDTLTLKLQGGPSSTLYIDVMKHPENLFTDRMLETYEFNFDASTTINDRLIYVLNFEQKPQIQELLYYGKVYIDAQTLAMTKAIFSLNLKDKERASKLFVRKKPSKAKVYPTLATYTIHYREKDTKWYYGYGSIDLVFKINWKKRLFNSTYRLNVEMAITDWKKNTEQVTLKPSERLKSSVVINDQASGFSDPAFWGQYNVIEPEKSIESAIKKIQKQLRKLN